MNESIMLLHNALIGCKFNSLNSPLKSNTPIAVSYRSVSGSTPQRQNEHILLFSDIFRGNHHRLLTRYFVASRILIGCVCVQCNPITGADCED